MREIRLRAWDRTSKCWRDVEEFIVGKNGAVVAIKSVNGTIYQVFKGQIDLLQSTGLKDKNGKEIYEGDILRGIWKGQVNYGDGRYYLFRSGELNNGMSAPDEQMNKAFCEHFEVIGNVWENPELISKEA